MKPGDDKHIFYGLLTAAIGAFLGAVQMTIYGSIHWPMVGFCGFLAAATAGVSVELAQDNVNDRVAEKGQPPVATVSGRDAALTAAPGLLLYIVLTLYS